MATYTEYLDFDTEEDKLKQQQLYQATELSAQTVAAVKKIKIGRASCGKECVSTCRSRWSPYH